MSHQEELLAAVAAIRRAASEIYAVKTKLELQILTLDIAADQLLTSLPGSNVGETSGASTERST